MLDKIARRSVKSTSPFSYYLSLLLPGPSRAQFRVWYAYLRWVDDSIDGDHSPHRSDPKFIERQLAILEGGALARAPLALEEEFLVWILQRSPGTEHPLRMSVRMMLEAINFDAGRRSRRCSAAELHHTFRREVSAYLIAIQYFCAQKSFGAPIGLDAGIAAKIIHILRDFVKDVKEGQINISAEDIKYYAIDLNSICAGESVGALRDWFVVQARIAEAMLKDGLDELKLSHNTRYKLIFVLLATKYDCYLRQLRAHRFTPIPDLRYPRSMFARRFLANLMHSAYPNTTVVPPSKPTLKAVHLPYDDHVGMRAKILTSKLRLKRELQTHLGRHVPDFGRSLRRFIVAYWMGRLSFVAIISQEPADHDLQHLAGLIYGYWSLCGIELDCLLDEGRLTADAVAHLSERWVLAAEAALSGNSDDDHVTLGNTEAATLVFRRLSGRFFAVAARYVATLTKAGLLSSLDISKQQFLRALSGLMSGQLDSRAQTNLQDPCDWAWYYRNILNTKNVYFFLAPLYLWTWAEGGVERFRRIEELFLLLNSAYLHYQLLDDVADLEEDLHQGVIAGPAAMLLAQGTLAEFTMQRRAQYDSGDVFAMDAALAEAIDESRLLCPELLRSPFFDRVRAVIGGPPPFVDHQLALRYALANTETDLKLPLDRLILERVNQARRYMVAAKSRELACARDKVLESGVCSRIVVAAGDEVSLGIFQDRLSPGDRAATRVLYILERLMQHTYRAAYRVAFS